MTGGEIQPRAQDLIDGLPPHVELAITGSYHETEQGSSLLHVTATGSPGPETWSVPPQPLHDTRLLT